jgi:hypothetical protein
MSMWVACGAEQLSWWDTEFFSKCEELLLLRSARYRAGSFSCSPRSPHRMRECFTPTQESLFSATLAFPDLESDSWSLTIDGLVLRPLRLGFADNDLYPKMLHHHELSSMLWQSAPALRAHSAHRQCRSGIRLADIMRECRPAPETKYLWSY